MGHPHFHCHIILTPGFATRVCDLLANPKPNSWCLTKPNPCCVSYQQWLFCVGVRTMCLWSEGTGDPAWCFGVTMVTQSDRGDPALCVGVTMVSQADHGDPAWCYGLTSLLTLFVTSLSKWSLLLQKPFLLDVNLLIPVLIVIISYVVDDDLPMVFTQAGKAFTWCSFSWEPVESCGRSITRRDTRL